MPFSKFTNPYQNPADVPQRYRKHPNLSKLFKVNGSYVRPAVQQAIVDELERLRNEAKRLQTEAEILVTEAKARVECMILGRESML